MVKTGNERAGKQGGADHAAAWPHEANAPHHYYMLSTSTSWPLDQCQEDHELPYPIHKSDHTPSAAAAPPPHTLSAVHPYSLSSAHHATSHSRRSAISSSRSPSSHTSSAQSLTTFSPTLSTSASPPMTSLMWDADEDHVITELPPIDPCDHLKTLLTQLASCISSITTAYAHQQAALISHHMRARDAEESGRHAAPDVIPATDEAMVSELHTLSNLHSQLALLPHMLPLKDACPNAKEQDSMAQALQLKQYEGIIARFHDEIRKKNAVTEALKDTLAKSMLKGEKLQRRLQALEAKFGTYDVAH